jgi:hypothetical protein
VTEAAGTQDAAGAEQAAQRAVARARAAVRGGRGRGAGAAEVLRHTRGRTTVAGVPVAALLERTAEQAARTRGDVEGLTLAVAVDRDRVAAGIARLQAAHPGRRPRARAGLLAVVALLLVRRLTRR